MKPRERVLAAVRGEPVDRVPFAVWRHFYSAEDAGARALAETLVGWVRKHDLDLLKYNPRAHYHAEPWDTRYRYHAEARSAEQVARGSAPRSGAPRYSGDERPQLVEHAVRTAADWRRIEPVPASHPVFVEMLEGIHIARALLPGIPLLMTIFTPLAVCERLAGRERLQADLLAEPEAVLVALDVVTETFRGFAAACLAAGADGIFLATTGWGSRTLLDDAEYARFGRPFDLRVLDAVRGAPLNVLHVCGDDARVVELADYPVAALSWNVHGAGNAGVGAFLVRVPDRGAIGGISDAAFLEPDGARARAEVARGLAETGGRRWIAAGGCTIPTTSADTAIRSAREALLEAKRGGASRTGAPAPGEGLRPTAPWFGVAPARGAGKRRASDRRSRAE